MTDLLEKIDIFLSESTETKLFKSLDTKTRSLVMARRDPSYRINREYLDNLSDKELERITDLATKIYGTIHNYKK